MKNLVNILVIITFLISCSKTDEKLPTFGHTTVNSSGDTIYSTIKPFKFINQDSIVITEQTFDNKIYVADFIFLSCPTICPKMTNELKNVYDEFKTNPHVYFLSHTIDPEHDTIPRLKEYAENMGVDHAKWFFVTGNKDSIYTIAEESYFASAFPDKEAPGGYIHSGSFLLIDVNKHIRGVYDGTDPLETKRLMKDLRKLLTEQFKQAK